MFHKTIITADKSKLSPTEAQRGVRIILAMFAVNLLITVGIALKLTVVSWDIGFIDRNCQYLRDRAFNERIYQNSPYHESTWREWNFKGDSAWTAEAIDSIPDSTRSR